MNINYLGNEYKSPTTTTKRKMSDCESSGDNFLNSTQHNALKQQLKRIIKWFCQRFPPHIARICELSNALQW